ncbi:MAG: SusD/RagB family nutrient-binding outer membrane lipoprotein, partial [Methanocorpusculum sp.]|nr:SusD/RagB family nutrient-binding outer membrane lipoprotein [Methanocorpusculum sp.]
MAVSLAVSSCNDWLDVNDNPNTPTTQNASIQNQLPWSQHYIVYAYAAQGYRAQFICQALTATSRTSRDGSSAQWNPSDALSTTPYQFFFVGSGPNLDDMYNKAMEKGAYHYAAAARLLRAYGFTLMADMYGEMPYKEAFGTGLNPKYDDGKTIYLGCISEVEEAIELLGRQQEAGAPALSEGDSWNGGDTGKWLKMAYLLKARLLNHMSKKGNGNYKDGKYDASEILACLEKAQQSNSDNTVLNHIDTKENGGDVLFGDPLQASPTFSNAGMGGGTTTRATQWLVDILTNFNGKGIEDPRADKILPWLQVNNPQKWMRTKGVEMRTAETIRLKDGGPFGFTRNASDKAIESDNAGTIAPHSWYCDTKATARQGDTIYVGFRSGAVGYYSTSGILYDKYSDGYAESTSNVYCRPNSPTQWASYAEACFIKAEVLFRQGSKAEAFTAYKNGIQANIATIQSALTTWNATTLNNMAENPSFSAMKQEDIDNFLNNAIGDAGSLSLEIIFNEKLISLLYTNEN